MNIRVGYIPYLNMVPFHHGFGPEPMEADGRRFEFHSMSPRTLGLHAEKGTIDAGALSLTDWLRSSTQYEPVGSYGIGLRRAAQSVLLFSNRDISQLQGVCAVTEDTSTSFRLLQILLEMRHGRSGIRYGRIDHRGAERPSDWDAAVNSGLLFEGPIDALLLIGDEALRAKKDGIRALPVVTDLGEEWFKWQNLPFVFARWAVRSALRQEVKDIIERSVQNALKTNELNKVALAEEEARKGLFSAREILRYWGGFVYELTEEHERSVVLFSKLMEKICLAA